MAVSWPSGGPAIDSTGEGRLPLLKGAGDEHGIAFECHIGNERSWHSDHPYEFFVVAAMVPFALDSSRAIGLALVLHAIMYFTCGVLGLACLWSESLSLRELKSST